MIGPERFARHGYQAMGYKRSMDELAAQPQDTALIEAWAAGDRASGAALAERHFAALYRFFRSKRAGDVDDLVQQPFMSCLEARAGFRGECSFRTWLLRIARRRLYDYYRSKRRDQALDFTTTSVHALSTTPSAALQRKDAAQAVREALQELPLESQILLELSYWEDLTTRELSQVFEVQAGTIKSRLFAARARRDAFDAEHSTAMGRMAISGWGCSPRSASGGKSRVVARRTRDTAT